MTNEQITEKREERKVLVRAARAAADEMMAARERSFSRDKGMAPAQAATKAARAAEKALFDFDAAYPEVLAAIKAEQQAKVEANFWN